jgi:hypothetical protein
MSAGPEARKPAVNSSESPGRKKPNKSPDSAKMIANRPQVPTSSMRDLGSRRPPAASTRPSIDPG